MRRACPPVIFLLDKMFNPPDQKLLNECRSQTMMINFERFVRRSCSADNSGNRSAGAGTVLPARNKGNGLIAKICGKALFLYMFYYSRSFPVQLQPLCMCRQRTRFAASACF